MIENGTTGQDSKRIDAARTAVDTYINAVRTADGEAGCDLLTEYGRERLALLGSFEDGNEECTAAFAKYAEGIASERETELEEVAIDEIELDEAAETATVSLEYPEAADAAPSSPVTLKWTDGRWLLDNIYEL